MIYFSRGQRWPRLPPTAPSKMDSIKAKIAKLLRMQESGNAGEAANAAHFVEKLCREHGISPDECSPDYDPERDVAIYWCMGKPFKRVDHAAWSLLSRVAEHFNGRTVSTSASRHFKFNLENSNATHRCIEVLATKGNKIQIELYYEYLYEVMEKLADEAKKEVAGTDADSRNFRNNFRKGFARAIGHKLSEQRKQQMQQEHQKPWAMGTELALYNRTKIEQREVNALVKRRFPNLGSSTSTYGGNGTQAGLAAGRNTSVNRQVNTAGQRALCAG